jgi:5-formyltetrahydrofolate cyclo-ligase
MVMMENPSIADRKTALRGHAMARRAGLFAAMPDAPLRMAENFLAAIALAPSAVVSAYWPMGDEADPRPLMEALRARGHGVALPRIAGKKHTPLAFHMHARDAALLPGAFGLSQPGTDWPAAIPAVLVVPLLAFDAHGHRLGYGGGFYDATLADLRTSHDIAAVGLAFAGQEVAALPYDAFDQRLDWIVTEKTARKFE